MVIFTIIHQQIKSFFTAGKKIRKPINKTELIISRLIALILLLVMINFYGFIFSFKFLPLLIYLRALIVLIPLVSFIIKFHRGISISWIISSIRKYWLVPLIFLIIYLTLVFFFYHIITENEFNLTMLYFVVGVLLTVIGFCCSTYFFIESYYLRKDPELPLADKMKMFFYVVLGLFFIPFLIGGLLYLAAGLKLIDLGT